MWRRCSDSQMLHFPVHNPKSWSWSISSNSNILSPMEFNICWRLPTSSLRKHKIKRRIKFTRRNTTWSRSIRWRGLCRNFSLFQTSRTTTARGCPSMGYFSVRFSWFIVTYTYSYYFMEIRFLQKEKAWSNFIRQSW